MYSILKNNKHYFDANELTKMCALLEEVVVSNDYSKFYSAFKKTQLPFIPCYEKDPKKVYQSCFEVLHKLGKISIPVSVALSMHYYVLASMAMYPFSKTSKEYWKREMLLQKIKKERLIIANTGSVRTFKNVLGDKIILAEREKDYYNINGEAPYMSLSGIADYMVFTAPLPENDKAQKAIFFIPSNDEEIEFSDSAFGDSMKGSFTRSVKFKDVKVSDGNVIKLDNAEGERCEILVYQRSWFQGLAPAPYLGATLRVLDELKTFSNQKIKNGKKLSESESFKDNLGELNLKYHTALQLCDNAAQKFVEFKKDDDKLLEQLFEATVLAKYQSTHFSEEIVASVRHLMGTTFLVHDSITNRIYKEIVFGVLQPMADVDIKKYFCEKVTA